MDLIVALILSLDTITKAATDCSSPYLSDICTVECGGTYTGFIERFDESYFMFSPLTIQKVTFTDCGSIDYTPYMYIYKYTDITTPINIGSVESIEDDADAVPDNQCTDTIYNTYTYSYLGEGSYRIRIINPSTSEYLYGQYQFSVLCGVAGSDSYDIVNIPSPSPTPSPLYLNGQFPGFTLFIKGFNIFTAELSGSPVLDEGFLINDTESYTTEGSTCSYSSLQFSTKYSQYSLYSNSDSDSLSAAYSADDTFGAGASLSTVRQETREHSRHNQYEIYTIDLHCVAAEVSAVEWNKIHWNSYFVDALRILPTTYTTGDSLEDYKEFWETYGTHVIETADLGGNIRGAVITDRCGIEDTFSSFDAYEVCLNAAYKGVSVEGCTGESEGTVSSTSLETYIMNMRISVKGGDTATFATIFNDFGATETYFNEWITDLATYPDVVGGNVDEIHDVIKKAIALGGHRLNDHLSQSVDDETFLSIASAMREAYTDYAKELGAEDAYFVSGECDIECYGSERNSEACVCNNCNTVADCCGIDDTIRHHMTVSLVFVTVILIIIL